jgi:hypothetical protein
MSHTIYRPRRTKRTKRAYQELHDRPADLFGPGAETIIYPNGEHHIWIKSDLGTFKITAGHGPAGFSVTVSSSVGDPAADLHALDRATYETTIQHDVREVTVIQYHSDPYSQAFKSWYESDRDEHGKHTSPHPAELGILPAYGPNGVRLPIKESEEVTL